MASFIVMLAELPAGQKGLLIPIATLFAAIGALFSVITFLFMALMKAHGKMIEILTTTIQSNTLTQRSLEVSIDKLAEKIGSLMSGN